MNPNSANNVTHVFDNTGVGLIDKSEIPVPEINPNDYYYYKVETTHAKEEDEFKYIDINDYVDPDVTRLIDNGLNDFFNRRHKGEPYPRLINSEHANGDNKFGMSSAMKSLSNKSVQTNRINVCTHYKPHTNKTNVDYFHCRNKFKEIKSSNKIMNSYQDNGFNNHLLPQIISATKKVTSNDIEETRKKLHITRISNNGPIFINKGGGGVSNNNNNNHVSNELRYINIKCNAKLQHIPITHTTLHKNNSLTSQNGSSTNGYLFNRNPNNYNFILKTQSSSSQTQELKTYSRKSENNGFLSNVISEHKYLIQQSSDKFHKIQNNFTTGIQKINNFYNNNKHHQSDLKLIDPVPLSSSTATSSNEHIKLVTNYNNARNGCCKENAVKGHHDNLLFSNNHSNCSLYMDYNSLPQTNGL